MGRLIIINDFLFFFFFFMSEIFFNETLWKMKHFKKVNLFLVNLNKFLYNIIFGTLWKMKHLIKNLKLINDVI